MTVEEVVPLAIGWLLAIAVVIFVVVVIFRSMKGTSRLRPGLSVLW